MRSSRCVTWTRRSALSRAGHRGQSGRPGGRHVGQGTQNAIIRFGLDYLELLAIYDQREAARSSLIGPALIEYVRDRGGGLAGYALAADVQAGAERFKQTIASHMGAEGPVRMQRVRPDGQVLSWVLLLPGGVVWRRPWPFLIEWDTPDDQRLALEPAGVHPNGVTGVVGIVVAASNLETAADVYQQRLGVQMSELDVVTDLAGRRATFQVGAFRIELLWPTGEGPTQQILQEHGEGPIQLTLTVNDLKHAREVLTQGGAHPGPDPQDPAALRIPSAEAPTPEGAVTGLQGVQGRSAVMSRRPAAAGWRPRPRLCLNVRHGDRGNGGRRALWRSRWPRRRARRAAGCPR
jgi:hypothetical protein